MKKILVSGFLAFIVTTGLFLSGFLTAKKDQVRHVVVFKYKPGTTEAQIEKVNKAFAELKGKIPGIVAFEYGINNSPEEKNLGFTHVYFMTFEDAESRDNYLPHPEHKEFGKMLGELQIIEDVFVVDYHPIE